MTERFIEIANESKSTLDDVKDDHKLMADKLGIDISSHYSPKLIQDEIKARIESDFNRNNSNQENTIGINALGDISETLIYKYLLFEEPVLEYLNILQTLFTIKDARIKKIPSFEESETWGRIITDIKNYQLVINNKYDISQTTIRDSYPQQFDRVKQIKKLINLGCKVSINGNDLIIDETEHAISKLDDLIKEIGGINLAKTIFNLLNQSHYSKYFDRYHLTRNGNGLSIHQKPQIPFGYLLNLSVKYPYESSAKNITKQLAEIQELSIAVVSGIYNVQHYNQWANFFQTGETIIQFCIEIALWDSLYSLIQIRPSLSLEIVTKLFDDIDDNSFTQAIGINKQESFVVLDVLLDLVKNINGPKIIYVSSIHKILKEIDKKTIQKILDLISHSQNPNSEYLLPSDFTNVDFQFNALIKLGNTKYLLMDKSWCAPSLFESFATGFRKAGIKNFDSSIGYSLEKLIYGYLDQQNISFCHGNYSTDGIEGECDLLIESEKAIVLVEFKKKVLTRKAKSGIDIDILIDLSDSIISSQLQAGRTELIFREKGELTLVDAKTGSSKTVRWKNRIIERVSLTQLDFGGFHDRTIINQFFNALLTHTYGTYSEEHRAIKKFDDLKNKQQAWMDQYIKLRELDKSFDHFPFFNCSFLNLGHLLEIIKLSNDNETFHDNLKSNKHVTFGTLDFYREFELKNNLEQRTDR